MHFMYGQREKQPFAPANHTQYIFLLCVWKNGMEMVDHLTCLYCIYFSFHFIPIPTDLLHSLNTHNIIYFGRYGNCMLVNLSSGDWGDKHSVCNVVGKRNSNDPCDSVMVCFVRIVVFVCVSARSMAHFDRLCFRQSECECIVGG